MSHLVDPAIPSNAVKLLARPIVIPRSYKGGRLYFFVVFGFHPERPPGADPLHMPNIDVLRNWPRTIRAIVERGAGRLSISDLWDFSASTQAVPDSWVLPIRWEQSSDLGTWSLGDAQQAWTEMIVPSLPSSAHFAQRRSVTSLRRFYREAQGQNVPSLQTNPVAASDWRPNYRLESLDLSTLSLAQFVAKAWSAGTPTIRHQLQLLTLACGADPVRFRGLAQFALSEWQSNPLQLQMELRALFARATEELPISTAKAPPFNKLERELIDFSAAVATSFTGGKLVQPFSPQDLSNPSKLLALLILSLVFRDMWLHVGRSEVRRMRNFVDSAANRWLPGPAENVSSAVAFGQHSYIRSELELKRPSFEELISRLQSHPGLRRRLYLTIRCSCDWPKEWASISCAEGAAQFAVNWSMAGFAGPSPFEPAPPATAFQLDNGNLPDHQSFFRSMPRHEVSFLEETAGSTPGEWNSRDAWRQYHVLPTQWYVATQQDFGLACARAPMELDTPPIGQIADHAVTDPFSEDSLVQRVNAVNFYSTPPTEAVHGSSPTVSESTPTARQLAQEFRNFASVAEALEARVHHQSVTALSTFDGRPRLNRRALAPPADRLYAESLMLGHTIYARREGHAVGPWRSLCRRRVCVSGGSITPIEFDEDAFLTSSMTIAGRPLVGQIRAVDAATELSAPIPNQAEPLKRYLTQSFQLDVGGAENSYSGTRTVRIAYEWGAGKAEPSDPEYFNKVAAIRLKTRLRGAFRSFVTESDLIEGDYALITPAERIGDNTSELSASEVTIAPLLELVEVIAPAQHTHHIVIAAAVLRSERYMVLLRPGSTDFLDDKGNALTHRQIPQNFGRFIVSGQRRFFVDDLPEDPTETNPGYVAGELVRVENFWLNRQASYDPRDPNATPPDYVVLSLKLPNGSTATIRAPGGATYLSKTNYPPRPLIDLEPGEFVSVQANLIPDTSFKGWYEAILNPQGAVVMRTGLRGTLSIPPVAPFSTLLVGSSVYRRFVVRTSNGVNRDFWYHALSGDRLFALHGNPVHVWGCPVVDADLVMQAGPDPAAAAPQNSTEPFSGMVSELIARWQGWSLAVKQPGKTDEEPPSARNLTFQIKSFLPDMASLPPNEQERWKLPPLRFDIHYRFCLRRTDLAGNHDWDEPQLPVNLGETAVAELETLLARSLRPLYRGWDRSDLVTMMPPIKVFQRADRPTPPLIGFKKDQRELVLQLGEPELPESPDCNNDLQRYEAVVSKRAPRVILFSDVFHSAHNQLVDYATCFLLPPPAAVDTVLMHGALDKCQLPAALPVANEIYRHEYYVDHCMKGLYNNPNPERAINYFGDPLGEWFKVELHCRGTDLQCNKALSWYRAWSPKDEWIWPDINRTTLTLIGENACIPNCPEDPLPPLKKPCPIEVRSKRGNHEITISLPAGTTGTAILRFAKENHAHDELDWGTVELIHAVNAACIPPKWHRLAEIVPPALAASPGQSQQMRLLEGSFNVHVPTSGGFRIYAYWNEVWDEGLPTQFRPAEVELCFNDASSLKMEQARQLDMFVRLIDGGFGYVSGAVVIVECNPRHPPTRLPVFQAHIVGDQVDSIEVVDPGEGASPESIQKLIVVRRPPMHRRAVARARVEGGLVKEVIVDPEQRGGWYAAPPIAIIHDLEGKGSGARCKAVPDKCGGVCRVDMECEGEEYSDNVEVRFYTHAHAFHQHPIPIKYDPADLSVPREQSVQLQLSLDAAARDVDFVVEVESRFVDYLLPRNCPSHPSIKDGASDQESEVHIARMHVPRFSPPITLHLHSLTPPQKPDVDYFVDAFTWKVKAPGHLAEPAEAEKYFVGRPRGELIIERQANTRVYLHRPWHGRGHQHLAVLVMPATINTVHADKTTPLAEMHDDAIDNPANRLDSEVVASAIAGGHFTYDRMFIPEEYRRIMSRWGYDPAYNETPLPPLTLSHFPQRVRKIHAELGPRLLPTAQAANGDEPPPQPKQTRHAWLALHDVQYDATKERWFADLRVLLEDRLRPLRSNPFIQFSLATFQERGRSGHLISEIVQCDFVKILGDRTMELKRQSQSRFSVRLTGAFEAIGSSPSSKTKDFPVRRIIARVQLRDPRTPIEVEVQQVPENSQRLSIRGSRSEPALHPTINLLERELQPTADSRVYQTELNWDWNDASVEQQQKELVPVLEIIEQEFFPTSDEAQNLLERADVAVIYGRICLSWTKFYYAIRI